jgi:hypothetical protein
MRPRSEDAEVVAQTELESVLEDGAPFSTEAATSASWWHIESFQRAPMSCGGMLANERPESRNIVSSLVFASPLNPSIRISAAIGQRQSAVTREAA